MSNLLHMYQAWCSGNDNTDPKAFIEFVANRNKQSIESVMKELENCKWFKQRND